MNQAEDAYNNAMKLNRSRDINAGSNFGLGEIYKKRGRRQSAIGYFKKAATNSKFRAAANYQIDELMGKHSN